MQKSLELGKITPGHARAILSVSTQEGQALLFEEILARSYSVRDAESRAAALSSAASNEGAPGAKVKPAKKQDPELQAIEQKFIEVLGTKVSVSGDFNRGHIQIDYYSMEDLDRIYEIFNR
jgi:ParB family chromosome partitioning protein